MADEPKPFTRDDTFVLGETTGEHRVARTAETADAALALTRQARYSLRIFTRDLDAPLYSTEAYRQAVSALARGHAASEVRILIHDPTAAIKADHRLIGLIQHLSSHIGIRRVASDWGNVSCACLIVDARGLLWRPQGDRFEGVVDFRAGARAVELAKWFDRIWENSPPDPEFRKLAL